MAKKTPRKSAAKTAVKSKQQKEKRQYLERPYPQKTLDEALKIPEAIREKNNGNPWSTDLVANAIGYTNIRSIAFQQLSRAAQDFELTIGTHTADVIELAPLGRRIVYPGSPEQEKNDKIRAFFSVDIFKKVYEHYGGAEFPERKYLASVLEDKFGLATELHDEFVGLFTKNCESLGIQKGLESSTYRPPEQEPGESRIRVVGKAEGKFERTAFVIMPFSEKGRIERHQGYFSELLEKLITPAGNTAGFAVKTAEQSGSDIIQSTIISQLLDSDLVIADLTDHNPNVLFELGIRIAKELPVALIKAQGTDPIFDVDNMMRVLPYDPTLWTSAIERDLPRLTDHIKAAWERKTILPSYISILTGRKIDSASIGGSKI